MNSSFATRVGPPAVAPRSPTASRRTPSARVARSTKSTLGNRELKPERSTEQEFGLDAIFFDRVSVQLNYAKVVTEDQLVAIPLPAAFGFSSQWQNAGTVEGESYEATIEASLIQRPDLQWTLGGRRSLEEQDHQVRSSLLPHGRLEPAFRCAGESLGTMYGARLPARSQRAAGRRACGPVPGQ